MWWEIARQLKGGGGICLCSLVIWQQRLPGTQVGLAAFENPTADTGSFLLSHYKWGHRIGPVGSRAGTRMSWGETGVRAGGVWCWV